ncbi:MAG: divergent PAP2 family protein [Candidatus Omnitrophica bacterium]|nr:divergent PAP2 family protein [Candidatus Omnitrophota bacterium]
MRNLDFFAIISQFSHNRILWVTVLVWITGQGIKIVTNLLSGRRFNFRWLIRTGGMPSSHAAGVTALSVCCGMEYGFHSGMFALAAIFAMVTMFDAQGVRRSAGEQAEVLNKVIDDMYWHKKVDVGRIREFVGHSPIQVLAGLILGLGMAVLLF